MRVNPATAAFTIPPQHRGARPTPTPKQKPPPTPRSKTKASPGAARDHSVQPEPAKKLTRLNVLEKRVKEVDPLSKIEVGVEAAPKETHTTRHPIRNGVLILTVEASAELAGTGADDAPLHIELPHTRGAHNRLVPLTITHGGLSLTDSAAVRLPRRIGTRELAHALRRHSVGEFEHALGSHTVKVKVQGRSLSVRGEASVKGSVEGVPPAPVKATASLIVNAEVPVGRGATASVSYTISYSVTRIVRPHGGDRRPVPVPSDIPEWARRLIELALLAAAGQVVRTALGGRVRQRPVVEPEGPEGPTTEPIPANGVGGRPYLTGE